MTVTVVSHIDYCMSTYPSVIVPPMAITLTLHADDLDHLRTMMREQLAGDHELMRDIHAGREPDETLLPDAIDRVMMIADIERQIGGLYGSGFAQEYADRS